MPDVYDEPLVLADDRAYDLWTSTVEQGTKAERSLGGVVMRFLQRLSDIYNVPEVARSVVEGEEFSLDSIRNDVLLEAALDIANVLNDTHMDGAGTVSKADAPTMRLVSGLPGGVDTSTRRGEQWARQSAARLVSDITRQQRDVIRTSVAESLRLGEGLPGLERRLINAGLGLTNRDQAAVIRYERRLIADGLPPGSARALASQYTTRLLNNRAMTIARTETFTALNRGRLDLWSDAIKRGDLPASARKVWVTAMDERVCPYCAPLDGITARVMEPFDLEPSRHTVNDADLLHPPLHPNCRCLIMLSVE